MDDVRQQAFVPQELARVQRLSLTPLGEFDVRPAGEEAPIGDPSQGGRAGFDAGDLLAATHARDHHLFGGKLDRRALGVRERVITRLVRVPEGDFRDLEIAVAWATAISRALTAGVPA